MYIDSNNNLLRNSLTSLVTDLRLPLQWGGDYLLLNLVKDVRDEKAAVERVQKVAEAMHIIQSLILVLYGLAQSDMSCKVRVGPDELKYIIKGGPRIIILVGYGWAQIYDICDLRVGPPPYNIIINRTLRVGPDILCGWAHLYIILLLAVHYGWAQIYYICYLRVGPPEYNIIISRTLRVGPNILYLSSTGGPTCI